MGTAPNPRTLPSGDPNYPYAHLNDDARWACACGYTGSQMSVMAHRGHGRGKRPQCVAGIHVVFPGADVELARNGPSDWSEFLRKTATGPVTQQDTAPEPPVQPPSEPESETEDESEPESAYAPSLPTYLGPLGDDPEEVARRLNAQRATRYAGNPILGLDDMYSPPPDNFNGGGWVVRGPDGEPQISQSREAVVMPLFVRAMYDHFRQQGWNSGDGSLSTFVVEALVDYFANVHGLVLIVAQRSEVEVG